MKKLLWKMWRGVQAWSDLECAAFIFVLCIASAMIIHAQAKPGPAGDAIPPMPAEFSVKLRDAVIAQAKLVIQLKDVIANYNNLQGALNAQAKTLEDLKAAAIKDAKLDPDKWDVDTENFKFVAKPEPAKVEQKKP